MRKGLLVGLSTSAVAIVAMVAAIRQSPAQQAAPPAPSELPAADTSKLAGPRQPIFFRHDIHAGQLEMTCQYCHYSVGVSSEPGIPSMQTCMGCHLVVGGTTAGNKAEIKKLRDAWNANQPVTWVRVHAIAKHAHFPHMRHIKALGPSACATCHGDVARMPQIYRVNNVTNMGFCISCHIERKVSRDCTVCHY